MKSKGRSILVSLSIVCMLVGAFLIISFADEKLAKKDVPSAVVAAFEKAYPKATVRGYGKEKENGKTFYEVESSEGTISRDVLFTPEGKIVEVEESMPPSELPQAISKAFLGKFPKATITKAEKIMHDNKTGYEVAGQQDSKRVSMELDSDGKILKVTDKEKEEDKK
jgi:hypothetical protein